MGIDEVIDQLYGLPPEEFTQARNEAERELRKAGQREQADLVKGLRKPTAAAGAVNRLVRSHRAEVEAFLEAAARLRDAQVAGRGDLAAAARAERTALDKLIASAASQYAPLSKPPRSTMTLQAAYSRPALCASLSRPDSAPCSLTQTPPEPRLLAPNKRPRRQLKGNHGRNRRPRSPASDALRPRRRWTTVPPERD
jgi:hypothetical protein